MTIQARHFNSLAEHLAHIDTDAKMTKAEIIHYLGAWCSQWNPRFDFIRFQDYVITQSKIIQQRRDE